MRENSLLMDATNWAPEPSGDGPIRTHFEYFDGGSIIDSIRPKRSRDVSLVLYDAGSTRIGDGIEHGDELYVPAVDPILEKMHLSRHIAIDTACPSFDELFGAIPAFLENFFDFSARGDSAVSGLFSLATWFSHRTEVAPYLSIVGPPGSGKSRLARCLSYFCRRALAFSGLTATSLRSIPMRFRPTLIMDEVEMTDDLARLLRIGTARELRTYHQGRTIDLFCPKIIVTQSPLADPGLASRVVQIRMVPTSRDMPHLTSQHIEYVESTLVPKIHRYFVENYSNSLIPRFDASCLSPHKRDVARALAAPFDTQFGQESVVPFLRSQDESANFGRSYTREAAVVEALCVLCGNPEQQFAKVGEIAKMANHVMESRGERLRFKARGVGPILNRLGFRTEEIGSGNRGIWIDQGVIKMTYNLARYHGVMTVQSRGGPAGGAQNEKSRNGQNPKIIARSGERRKKTRKAKYKQSRNVA